MTRRTVLLSLGIVAVAGVAMVALLYFVNMKGTSPFAGNTDASILDTETLEALPKKSASSASFTRLVSDITPPTNSWISGAVLQEQPMAIYPMPLSFHPFDTGFQMSLPNITSAETVITGGHTPALEARITGANSFQLTRFDKTSAAFTYKNNDSALGRITVTQGSPYVFYRALEDSQLIVTNVTDSSESDGRYTFTKDGATYTVAPHEKASIAKDGGSLRITAPKNSLVTFYATSGSSGEALGAFSGNEITGVEVNNETQSDASLTLFEYKTANNQPTAVSFLPYAPVKNSESLDTTFRSIYGDMKTYQGKTFTVSVPLVKPANELDIKKLSDTERAALKKDLEADSANLSIEPQDTYFAGKQLARLANLLSIAKQLGEDEAAERLQNALKAELTKRLDGSYLYYDDALKGIAAQNAAFGSEDFNDHHFHYGYFIYAAGILGSYDTAFVNEYKNDVNLLVADIASYEQYEAFPIWRTYDPYSGHAWAAGLAPFQDGNNQESSSEALNAWNAVALWADVIGNRTLLSQSTWMLSNEAHTAKVAWRSVDDSPTYLSAYESPVASLSFGGKRTYSTFFSDESNAKLGIQLIPMSPVMELFKEDGDAILTKLAAQDQPGNYNVALGDYLLMYLALYDKAAALEELSQQTNAFIDDGNSRTYLRAWIYCQ